MKNKKVVFVDAGDFFGLYVDGVLKYQDSSYPDAEVVLDILEIPFQHVDLTGDAADAAINDSCFPQKLGALRLEDE